MAKSLNRVQLLGNLTRDPELRYTPSGRAVASFAIATNRSWTTDTGEKREEVDFHNIVAWGKLGEICSQFLAKGRKAYVEGRLTTRSWTAPDGAQKTRTEVVIDDMILLDNKGNAQAGPSHDEAPLSEDEAPKAQKPAAKKAKVEEDEVVSHPEPKEEEVAPDDIPF